MIGFLVVLSFISVLLLSYQLLSTIFGTHNYISRLRSYAVMEDIKEEKKKSGKKDNSSSLGEMLAKGIRKVKFLDGYKKRIQVNLTRAHLLLKTEEFMTLNLVMFFVFTAIMLLINGVKLWPLTLIAGIVGWFLPSIVIKNMAKKRIKLLNEQLADAITMVSNSLRAGYSFFQAIDMITMEMSGPIAEEFTMLKKEVNLGLTTEKALENMTSRVSSEDLELVVTAVMIQRQVGGNLTEVLDNITSTISDRVKIKGEIRALTAQGRMSGLVISLLPIILCGIIYLINPKQMSLLFTEPLGRLMIGVAIVMELTGIALIRKVVRIEI